jgi:hypothetical protein
MEELLFIPYRKKDKWGFCNRDKTIVIDCIYEDVELINSGELISVQLNGKWGCLNYEGEQVVECIHDNPYYINTSVDNLSIHMLNGKYGFRDSKGNVKVPCKYQSVSYFSDGMAPVKLNDRWGFVNINGDQTVDCLYESCYEFSDGLALVECTESYGQFKIPSFDKIPFQNLSICFFIDKEGRKIVSMENYSNCNYFFSEGMLAVCKKKKWGYINKKGESIVGFIYDEAYEFSNGLARVGRIVDFERVGIIDYTIMDYSGEEVLPILKYGYIDKTGNNVIAFKYGDNSQPFWKGLAKVTQFANENIYAGFIDKYGSEYWED